MGDHTGMHILTYPVASELAALWEELDRLELRIARRADELARLGERDVACDYWQTAEREFLPNSLIAEG